MLVLIADHRPEVHFYLDEIIAAAGHESISAFDAQEAIGIYMTRSPQLILADLDLPPQGGLRVLESIRRQDSDVFFVLMTAIGSEEAAAHALDLRANNYLAKPPRFETLVALLDKYSAILRSREMRQEVLDRIVSRELVIQLDNRLDLVPETVELLLTEAGGGIPREERGGVQLGLFEIIVNSIEHGNLGITFMEKRRCLIGSPNRLTELVMKRSSEPERARKRVTIEFRMDAKRLEWTVQDQGDGFDWTAVPNPLEQSDEALNGRGIFLARYQFDEVIYLGNGNRVRLVRKRV